MSLDAWNDKCSEPDLVKIPVRIIGAGNAQVGKAFGRGVTLNRTGVGIVQVIFGEKSGDLGAYMGFFPGFDSATQANLKGFTAIVSAPVAVGATMVSTLNITSNADTLADLAVGQFLTLLFMFRRNGG